MTNRVRAGAVPRLVPLGWSATGALDLDAPRRAARAAHPGGVLDEFVDALGRCRDRGMEAVAELCAAGPLAASTTRR
jgi:hypothetical protein